MLDRVGVIDLGSNTFHILIVDADENGSFDTIYRERCFVGLAEEGIEKISKHAIQKGLEILTKFKQILVHHNVSKYKVTGTAALRTAQNKDVFINAAQELLDIEIEVIGGQREAELIFKGVSLLHPMNGNHLIIDIGGGSVEFVLVKEGRKVWSKSANIGVGVLHSKFHKSEPIAKEEISNLKDFLAIQLKEMIDLAKDWNIDALIGASGSFEVVESMNNKPILTHTTSVVSLSAYAQVSNRIIRASRTERDSMEGLPSSRVKLIVVAMILIDFVIDLVQPNEIIISPFALKEGLLSELYS